MRGMPWLLAIYCFIDGAVTYLLQEDKKRLAEARAKEQRELALQQKQDKAPEKKKAQTTKKAETPAEEEPATDESEPKDE